MNFYVGTSGYSYPQWKGSFYPQKLPQKQMLHFYGEHFSTVEINNTFYNMPTTKLVQSWAEQVPESFQLVLKAPRTITHDHRLLGAEEDTATFLEAASALKNRQGP